VIFLSSDIVSYLHSHPDNINSIKLDYDKIDFKEISVFCFDILKSILYCSMSKHKKIKTKLIFDKNLDTILINSDQKRIKQMLLNFISNSVKFTSEGFIKLIFRKSKNKDYIVISVKDTGIGIKDNEKKFLFQEFY